MLVIGRERNQRVILYTAHGPIVLTVTDVRNGGRQVRLGFEAPDSVRIVREELLDEPLDEGLYRRRDGDGRGGPRP